MKISMLVVGLIATACLGGCATIDEAMGTANLDGSTSGMSCEDMSKKYTDIANSQRRIQAVARLSGGDTVEIRQQYAEVLQQVRDAQIAAGCM